MDNGVVNCECHANWTGHFCDERCQLDCGEYGHCVIHDIEVCVCKWNHTGVRCEIYDPAMHLFKGLTTIKLTQTPWAVVGICLALILLLLLIFIVMPYFMYRRKWIPVRKLVHYFQQYEDDDGKEYDAFVSYKSCKHDEDFVVHKLYPKLEKEKNFKLCLHFRDFLPGEPIANSIIQAIENSRRTIMILTPNYIKSEWCRLEYQKAQHEMLKLKHKIIPIILEDISHLKDMDKNLKSILDTVTYIDYPPEDNSSSKRIDKFWKMLELTMPKKKIESKIPYNRSTSEVPLTSVPSITLSDDVFPDVINVEPSVSVTTDEFPVDVTQYL